MEEKSDKNTPKEYTFEAICYSTNYKNFSSMKVLNQYFMSAECQEINHIDEFNVTFNKKLKIAFVTRKDVNNNHKHVISTIYNLGTDDLLLLTNFSRSIGWGIFKEIISIIKNYKEDGNFILMKTFGETSAKSLLKLYKVPDSYFKSEEGQEE